MLSKENIISRLIPRLNKLDPGEGIILTTYKRNRSLTIICNKGQEYTFIQRGYEQKQYNVSLSELKKHLKRVLKIEFPRSNIVRIYSLREKNFLDNLKKI
ncbi:MAG: hypothetical protein Q9M37_09405 [Desulfonauticus sp.]|nr:hypothetical protein [Desulfonauticus sp.]